MPSRTQRIATIHGSPQGRITACKNRVNAWFLASPFLSAVLVTLAQSNEDWYLPHAPWIINQLRLDMNTHAFPEFNTDDGAATFLEDFVGVTSI